MCGITGYIGNVPFSEDKIKLLMLYNESRGKDSTGYYTPISDIQKSISEPNVFLSKKIKEDILFIGHCRRASMGMINLFNAHPFKYSNIVGIHNGHIKEWKNLLPSEDKSINISLDSAALIFLLAKYKDPRILIELPGSVAVLFADTRQNFLFAFRNKERPLYYSQKKHQTYISSIPFSLQAIGFENIEEFKDDLIYKILPDGTMENVSLLYNDEINARLNTDIVAMGGKHKNKKVAFKNEMIKIKINKKDNSASFKSSIYQESEYIINKENFNIENVENFNIEKEEMIEENI